MLSRQLVTLQSRMMVELDEPNSIERDLATAILEARKSSELISVAAPSPLLASRDCPLLFLSHKHSSHLKMSHNKTIKRKRVAIVGAGSAGMSAAWALSLSPDEFEVTLFERSGYTGGMATSTEIEHPEKYGASYINDGVQGQLKSSTELG